MSSKNGIGRNNGRKLRAAAYCRVSTDREEQENSFENQVAYYTNYINSSPEYELAGIYADEGISGTGTKKRTGFQQMIRDCEERKIDIVITKSISRFARNTADCLLYSRKLKNLGIPIFFEKEHVSTMDASGELLFTVLSSLAQEESHNISSNTAWGIRSNFKKGIPALHGCCIMGYDQGPDRKFYINEEEAKLVRRIYREFEEGMNVAEIARELNEEGICGLRGKTSWVSHTILGMLQNEFYKGDLLMQKTYVADYLTKKTLKNEGKLEKYYVREDHAAIIDPDEWEAVQEEIERREHFRLEHKIGKTCYSGCEYAFFSKVFCGRCGGRYGRVWKRGTATTWICKNRHQKGKLCCNDIIKEKSLQDGFVIAWNSIVQNRECCLPRWKEQIENGTALQRLRAKQMILLTEQGKITTETMEHTRMVLERAEVYSCYQIKFFFLDGSIRKVQLQNDVG